MKKGFALYKALAKRDYSLSEADCYAQLLQTLFSHLRADLIPSSQIFESFEDYVHWLRNHVADEH